MVSSVRISQASLTDMTDLDKAYSIANPKDPDRAIYKIMYRHDQQSVFVLRKNGKIVCAAYCIGFPTGSSCLGGIFLDRNKGNAGYILDIIRRCLQHLNAKGFRYVFSSISSHNIEQLETLKKAGFEELYKRSVGYKKRRTFLPSPAKCELLSDPSDIKKAINQLMSKDTIQKNTFPMLFWPHMLSDESISYLLKSRNLLVLVNENKDAIVVSHRIFIEHQNGRWFILPTDTIKDQANAKNAGEIMFSIGQDVCVPLSESIRLLDDSNIDRIYCYDYEGSIESKSYEQLGFSFQQPQIILYRKVNVNWSVIQAGAQSSLTLDKYWHS
jgi:hypothetical protein